MADYEKVALTWLQTVVSHAVRVTCVPGMAQCAAAVVSVGRGRETDEAMERERGKPVFWHRRTRPEAPAVLPQPAQLYLQSVPSMTCLFLEHNLHRIIHLCRSLGTPRATPCVPTHCTHPGALRGGSCCHEHSHTRKVRSN